MLIISVAILSMSNFLDAQKGTLQQLHILFRHGARNPSGTYPTDPHRYDWQGGWGQLTNDGKKQMYNLGENLRQHYEHFISNYYSPADVNFTSSYADRCLTSAQLVAAGMFPPQGEQIWNYDLLWQPVPIHYLPRSIDSLIAMKSACLEYDKVFTEVTTTSKKILDINQEHADLYKYLSKHSGLDINNIGSLESLFYILDAGKENNLTLPHWVNESVFEKMKNLSAQNLALYSETNYMKKMKGGFFLKTVFDLMQEEQCSKINLYSGHDLTIVHVMRALNLADIIKPEYGAAVIFELHTNSIVRILYQLQWNSVPKEQDLSYCKKHCTLERIVVALDSMLPKDWEAECLIRRN